MISTTHWWKGVRWAVSDFVRGMGEYMDGERAIQGGRGALTLPSPKGRGEHSEEVKTEQQGKMSGITKMSKLLREIAIGLCLHLGVSTYELRSTGARPDAT